MSKIEDALKKAKQNSSIKSLSYTPVNNNPDFSNVRNINKSNALEESKTQIVKHTSSAKEIALMKEKELIDQKELSEYKIIYSDMPDIQFANIYRDLRTKILQKSKGSNFVVMLTSCVSGGDVNNVVLNLATAFAFDESKTSLVIDCNINNPQLNALIDIESDIGLTDYLENSDIKVETIIQSTGIKRLRMIPAGSTREICTEYFTSSRMRKLMSDLIARYNDRYLFINTAPITDSADTRILVDMCDFVILVVPYGLATKNKIKLAAESIGKDKLLGVVFNNIPVVPLSKKS